jgi:hypothetical protein
MTTPSASLSEAEIIDLCRLHVGEAPLCITRAELEEGFAMIDRALTRLEAESTKG